MLDPVVVERLPTASVRTTALLERLADAVRPEFLVDSYIPVLGDPVLGGPPCLVPRCERPADVDGLCNAHYLRWRRRPRELGLEEFLGSTSPVTSGRTEPQACEVTGCGGSSWSRALCERHWDVWKRSGRHPLADFCATAPAVEYLHGSCSFPACEFLAGPSGWCSWHHGRWKRQGRPEPQTFIERVLNYGLPCFRFAGVAPQPKLELQYALQCRHDERKGRFRPAQLAAVIHVVRERQLSSVLDLDSRTWSEALTHHHNRTGTQAFARFAWARLNDLLCEVVGDEYGRDTWNTRRLGIGSADSWLRFGPITQPWLRDLAKRWVRWRLNLVAAQTVQSALSSIGHLSAFLHRSLSATAENPGMLTREVLEGYLASLRAEPTLTDATRSRHTNRLRGFLDDAHEHGWEPRLPPGAIIFRGDFRARQGRHGLALDEHVVVQIEHEENLVRIDDARLLVVVRLLLETGMRIGDILALPFDPVGSDSAGSPFLRYVNHKMDRDSTVPISTAAVEAIRAQQRAVAERWSGTAGRLLPRDQANPDGLRPLSYTTCRKLLRRWLQHCDIRDARGEAVHDRVTPHQFRHTVGTRMINNGVPQHVVQRFLDHRSPAMTAHYARLYDTTLRREWERYRERVNVRGEVVRLEAPGPESEAEWTKQRLGRAKETLSNGYCGRPLQQECPHPNACLTCPDFLTTVEFLPVHREQLQATRKLIATATADGRFRLAEVNRRVEANLATVVGRLEELDSNEQG